MMTMTMAMMMMMMFALVMVMMLRFCHVILTISLFSMVFYFLMFPALLSSPNDL